MSFTKDPQAALDYVFDWSAWLATSETISSVVVTVPTGITKDSQATNTNKVTVWLSGGTVGQLYPIGCRITTNQGRTDERTLSVSVRDK